MTDVAQRDELEQSVPLTALFTAFLAVSLCGVGGGGGLCGRAASPSRSVAGSMTANLPTSSAFASSYPGRTSSELPCASEQRCGARSERSQQFPAFSSSRG